MGLMSGHDLLDTLWLRILRGVPAEGGGEEELLVVEID